MAIWYGRETAIILLFKLKNKSRETLMVSLLFVFMCLYEYFHPLAAKGTPQA